MSLKYLTHNMKFTIQFILAIFLLALPAHFTATATPQSAPNISVDGSFVLDKVARGGTARGTVVMEIPWGYHAHSNRPLEKFLIATQLQVEAPRGFRVGPTVY